VGRQAADTLRASMSTGIGEVLSAQFDVSRVARQALDAQSAFSPALLDALSVQVALSPYIRESLAPELRVAPALQRFLKEVDQSSAQIAAQIAELDSLPPSVLNRRVTQSARGWRLGTQPQSLIHSASDPELLYDLGNSVQSVNSATYAVQANDEPQGEPWLVARSAETDFLLDWLESISPKLPTKYKGAWSAASHRGPDWISQAANSGVELLDWTLRTLAPDKVAIEWRSGLNLYANEVGENGRPHRSLRVRYIAAQRSIPSSTVDLIVKAVSGVLGDLKKLKYADDDAMASAVTSALMELEYCLLMLRGRI
jgi:hypothetical protein